MACSIPDFNLDFSARYDISTVIPSVVITNLSTGSNLANIDYFFVLTTPSGVVYHTGSFASPDASGVWLTINIAEPIPQSGGHIEFSNIPYSIVAYAKDNLGNLCDLTKLDIICAPTGNNNGKTTFGKNNFGWIALNVVQKCLQGRLEITDITNYVWNGIIGVIQGSETILVYPADESGVAPANAVVNNQNAFSLPIPINGKGYQLFRNATQLYEFPSGNEILIKYKYEDSCLEINCGMSLCSMMCGLKKYRLKLTDSVTGKCDTESQTAINALNLLISEFIIATFYPACGHDANDLHTQIKDILLKNDCYCDCNGTTGNNDVTALECSGIDIACVWNQIVILLNADSTEKDKFCNLVEQCVNAMNAGVCSQPFMSNVIFSPTLITVNFNLTNVTNSTSLEVYYKLHSSGVWILAATLASNATTYDIVGVFTEGELYDVKVVNTCSVGGPIDSAIITGAIPPTLDACYYLSIIGLGLANGVYGFEVDSTEPVDCDKVKPKLIDAAYIATLIPCDHALNATISAASLLEWTGVAGDWQISYKLKAAGVWTVWGTNTYAGTDHSEDLSALALTPLEDYEFRLIHECAASNSLPVYTDYTISAASLACPSAGDFISFDEFTGELLWAGNFNPAATYLVTAYFGATPLGAPIFVAVSIGGETVTVDYSNLLPTIATMVAGDKIVFYIQQDCGSGSASDYQSYAYTVTGATVTCPTFNPGFSLNVADGIITINPGGGTVPNAAINAAQYEISVNGDFAGIGDLVIDGGYETKAKSLIPILDGDTIGLRFRSFCACCDNNTTSSSAWSAFATGPANVTDGWDDIWKTIPGGWYANGATAGAAGAFYKIDTDGKFHLRGDISTNAVIAAGTNNYNLDFLDITTIYSLLNPNTLSAADTDFFSMPILSPSPTFVAAEQVIGRFIQRVANIFTYDYSTTSVAGTADVVTFGISHLRDI